MLMIICANKKDNLFLTSKNDSKIMFLDKICHLKNIKEKNNILLLDCNLLKNDGIIYPYNFYLEEVLISININYIICININDKIKEICEFHKIKYFDI